MGRGWWVLVSPEARVRLDSCQNLCSFQMILEIQWCPGRQSSRHEALTGSSACHSPAESKTMLFVNMKIHESTQAEITIVGHWQGKIHEKSGSFRYCSPERGPPSREEHHLFGIVSIRGPQPHPHLAVSDQPLLLPH